MPLVTRMAARQTSNGVKLKGIHKGKFLSKTTASCWSAVATDNTHDRSLWLVAESMLITERRSGRQVSLDTRGWNAVFLQCGTVCIREWLVRPACGDLGCT